MIVTLLFVFLFSGILGSPVRREETGLETQRRDALKGRVRGSINDTNDQIKSLETVAEDKPELESANQQLRDLLKALEEDGKGKHWTEDDLINDNASKEKQYKQIMSTLPPRLEIQVRGFRDTVKKGANKAKNWAGKHCEGGINMKGPYAKCKGK